MSQMATARALPRSGATKAPRPLRLIAPAPPGHAGLVATCLVLLTAGFVAVLLLNTSMATGAFTVSRLQDRADELSDTRTALQHAVDAQSAPAELAKRALDLGMVPSTSAAFLRISDGQVLGVAEPAAADTGFTVVAQAGSARAAAPARPRRPRRRRRLRGGRGLHDRPRHAHPRDTDRTRIDTRAACATRPDQLIDLDGARP